MFKKFLLNVLRIRLNLLAFFSKRRAGHLAYNIFTTPRKGGLRAQDLEFLKTAQWAHTLLRGLKIQYYIWENTGPTVLMAHGWESNSARWKRLIKRLLKAGYRVVALDAPAHGGSGSPQFSAVLYGEFIGVMVDLLHPDCAVGHSGGGLAIGYHLENRPDTSLKKAAILGAPSTLRGILDRYTIGAGISEAARQGLDDAILEKFGKPVEYFSLEDYAEKFRIPGLIIHDEGDATAPIEEAERLHGRWKNAQLVRTQGLGHSLQGEKVFEAVLNFLQEKNIPNPPQGAVSK
jgi:pimeloyl-ACP methyl ester carboxylesterase